MKTHINAPGLTEAETDEFNKLEVESSFFGLTHMTETKIQRLSELYNKSLAAFNKANEDGREA